MHRSQVLFYLLSAFILGVFIASVFSVSYLIILILFSVGVLVVAISGYNKTFSRKGLLVGFILLVSVFGMARFNTFQYSHTLLEQTADRKVKITMRGYVDGEMNQSGKVANFKFKVKEIQISDGVIDTDENILVVTDKFPVRKFGEALIVIGAPETPKNFSTFDYVTYLKKEGVRIVIPFPKIQPTDQSGAGKIEGVKIKIFSALFNLKNRFQYAVTSAIGQPYGAYINGVILGSRQDILPDIKDAFNKTGTTHILAISGYNITIIGNALLAVLVLFMRRRKAFWISIVVIILFTILTGASSSVVRAAIMGLILLFANGYGRLYDSKNSILLAGAVMIYLNPFVLLFDIGFQLSFMAVIGIIFIYQVLNNITRRIPEKGSLKETLLMTISAQIMVAPLLVYYFRQFSLVSLPANVLVLPLMPYTMLFGFLAGLGGLILVPLGKAVGLFALALSFYQLHVIRWLGSLEFSSLTFGISLTMLTLVYIILILVIYSARLRFNND